MSRLHYYLSRRIMTGRSERLHVWDKVLLAGGTIGFLLLWIGRNLFRFIEWVQTKVHLPDLAVFIVSVLGCAFLFFNLSGHFK